MPAQNLVPIPDEISFVKAHGVGQAAIQIAFLHGARVFATAGSSQAIERARALGAFEVIDHYTQDIGAEIGRLTNHRGVDVVIQHVGESTWAQSLASLGRGGRLVTCGATTGANAALDLRALFTRRLSIQGSYLGAKGELMCVARFFVAGRLDPVIDRTFPIQDAAIAQHHLETGKPFGKAVLEVR